MPNTNNDETYSIHQDQDLMMKEVLQWNNLSFTDYQPYKCGNSLVNGELKKGQTKELKTSKEAVVMENNSFAKY